MMEPSGDDPGGSLVEQIRLLDGEDVVASAARLPRCAMVTPTTRYSESVSGPLTKPWGFGRSARSRFDTKILIS
jgi:hypothetical protein